jgi:hypothetical protein
MRYQQPQGFASLDRANPLTTGLVASYLSGNRAQGLTLAGSVSEVSRPSGTGLFIGTRNANNYVSINNNVLPGGDTKYTIIQIVATADKTANPGQDCFSQGDASANSILLLTIQAGNLIDSWWGSNDLSATYTPANNELAVIAATYDGNTKRIYVNGAQIGSKSVTPGVFNISVNNTALVGKRGASTSNGFAGFVGGAHVFNRALSDSEIKQLSSLTGFWQIFKPSSRVFLKATSTGASASLAITTGADIFSGSSQVAPAVSLAITDDSSVFSGASQVSPASSLAVTSDADTFVGASWVSPIAGFAITADAATFAGSSGVATATSLAITVADSVFYGSSQVSPIAGFALATDSSVFSGSSSSGALSSGASTSLSITTGSSVFVGSAFVSAIAGFAVATDAAIFAGSSGDLHTHPILGGGTVGIVNDSPIYASVNTDPIVAVSNDTSISAITGVFV